MKNKSYISANQKVKVVITIIGTLASYIKKYVV